MNRVGVLTLVHTINFGAELQALALCNAIKGLGFDCELIDYRCPAIERREAVRLPSLRKLRNPKSFASGLCVYPQRRARSKAFVEFDTLNMPYGPNIESANDLGNLYDAVVVGSDQVWNPSCTGGDSAYLLEEAGGILKVAYAASFGDVSLNQELRPRYQLALADFAALGMREGSGVEAVFELGISGARTVLDPTLLIKPRSWRSFATLPSVPDRYVLAYFVAEKKRTLRFAEERAQELGAHLVVIGPIATPLSRGAVLLNEISPADFVGLIDNAEFVVTSSFHGMCFCINFCKNFWFVIRDGVDEHRSRICELSQLLGLQGADARFKSIYAPIAYEAIQARLTDLRKDSIEFLDASLQPVAGGKR